MKKESKKYQCIVSYSGTKYDLFYSLLELNRNDQTMYNHTNKSGIQNWVEDPKSRSAPFQKVDKMRRHEMHESLPSLHDALDFLRQTDWMKRMMFLNSIYVLVLEVLVQIQNHD